MAKISLTKTVQVPVETAWRLLAQDFVNVYRFHPSVAKSYAVGNTQPVGVGTERVCQLYDGNEARERIIRFEENSKLGISIVESSLPLESMEILVTFQPRGSNQTEINLQADFQARGLMKLMHPVMKSKFRKLLGGLMESMEHHAITGQLIGKGGIPIPAQAAA